MEDPAERSAPGASDRWALVGLLVLAAAIRAIAWSRTAVLFNDGPIFLAMAEALREGRFVDVLAHPQHPLYPALVAGVESFAGAPETAAIFVSIAGGVLAVAAIFWMAWRRFGRTVAWVSAWAVALHPWAVDFSSDVQSDGLYAGLFLAGFALLVDLLERPSAARAAGFGVLSGLAYWTRPEGLVLAGVAVVCLLGRALERPAERRRLVGPALVSLIVCAGLAGAFAVVELRSGEGLAFSQKKSLAELAQGGPSAEEIARDRRERRAARDDPRALPLPESSIRADGSGIERPTRSLIGLGEAFVRAVATSLSAFRHELFLFAALGAWMVASRRARAGRAFERVLAVTLVGQTGLLVLLVWGAGYVSRRHALAAWLPLTVFAAVGWCAAVERLRSALEARRPVGSASTGQSAARRSGLVRRLDGRGAVLLAALVLLFSWGPRDLRERRADRALERVAAEWLKAGRDGVGPVAAQKRRTAYYAGAAFVPLPDGRDGRIERQLRDRGARWLVIDAAKLDDHAGLAEGIGRWLAPVHAERAGSQEVLILEVTQAPAP